MSKSNSNEPKKAFDLDSATRNDNIRLHKAVRAGDVNLVKMLLNSGLADINYRDNAGCTVLFHAASANDVEMTKLLLKFKPTLTFRESRCSPIWIAALSGASEIVSLLVEAGADVNQPLNVRYPWEEYCPDKRDMTLLHLAVSQIDIPKITLLLDHGADINAVDKDYMSPLHTALQHHSVKTAKMLLEKGASIDSVNGRGETILQTALLLGNSEVISIILSRKPELNIIDKSGRNALHYLAQSQEENPKIAKDLLKEGISVNQSDTDRCATPLHDALMSNKPSLVHLFLKYGADVNLSIKSGTSAIHLATVFCSASVIRELLEKGANPNTITGAGETPLHRACRQNSEEKISTLLKYGADINVLGASSKSAIESLKNFRSGAAKTLVKHIAKIESFDSFVDESILRFIANNNVLKTYRDSSLKELKIMKSLNFYNNFSFHYVLKQSIEKLSKLAANEEFTNNFKLFRAKSRFSRYGNEVDINFKEAVDKMISYNRLIKHLSLVFYHRYDSILEHIVKYLKPTDLPLTLA